MKKILFVDSWSVGIQIASPIIEALDREGGLDLTFVHFDHLIEKYSGEVFKKSIRESKIQNPNSLKVVDLVEYENSAVKFLQANRPDLLVFISIHNLEQRFFLNVAEKLKIKTILIMHGVILKRGIINEKSFFDKITYPVKKFKRLNYYIQLFKLYSKDLKEINNESFNYKLFFKIIFNKEKYVNSIDESEKINVDTICTTSLADKNFYVKHYNLKEGDTRYRVTGHLDASKAIDYLKTNEEEIKALNHDTMPVIFFSQPHVRDGAISEEQYKLAISNLKKSLDVNSIELIIRPHPRDDLILLEELSSNLKIKLSSATLEQDLFRARFIVSINSTILITAKTLRKNILILDFGFADEFVALEENSNTKIVRYDNFELIRGCVFELEQQSIGEGQNVNYEDVLKSDPIGLIKKEIDFLLYN